MSNQWHFEKPNLKYRHSGCVLNLCNTAKVFVELITAVCMTLVVYLYVINSV